MTQRTCTLDGCESAHRAKGLCLKHYNRHIYLLRRDPERHAAFLAERAAKEIEKRAILQGSEKPCTKCKTAQPKTEFTPMPSTFDGLHSWCKACCRLLARESYNPAKAREYHSSKKRDPAYRAMKKAAYTRWRAEHPDRAKVARDRWVRANPERVWATTRAWRAANADLVRVSKRVTRQRRRAAKAATTLGPVRLMDVLRRDGMVCHLCCVQIASVDDLHFDHVVPLSRGGAHTMGNIKPAHARCNLRKHNKFMSELDWVVTA